MILYIIYRAEGYTDEPIIFEKDTPKQLENRKSAGCDRIPAKLIKAGGDETVLTRPCNSIWKTKMAFRMEEIDFCPDP